MEPLIAEHSGHLLGVLDPQRHQTEAFRDDRGAVVEWADRLASVDQRAPTPTSTTAIVQGLSPLFRQACLVPF
jgi:YD repeat-containing protein